MTITRLLTCTFFATNLVIVSDHGSANDISEVIAADKVQWAYLNPLRGNKSPGAADLWGDRTRDTATGMLVKFNKGFSSPPHIHNITYRGVVIRGLLHNDDPKALPMWMPTGSFWTQPAGADHITAADGEDNLIYLEIDSGPYLVRPSTQHFDNAEMPVNLHATNLVWLTSRDTSLVSNRDIEVALLWGSMEPGKPGGSLIRVPAGFKGSLSADADEFRAVLIEGTLVYQSKESNGDIELQPGSYFGSNNNFDHRISTTEPSIIYVRTDGRYRVHSQY